MWKLTVITFVVGDAHFLVLKFSEKSYIYSICRRWTGNLERLNVHSFRGGTAVIVWGGVMVGGRPTLFSYMSYEIPRNMCGCNGSAQKIDVRKNISGHLETVEHVKLLVCNTNNTDQYATYFLFFFFLTTCFLSRGELMNS